MNLIEYNNIYKEYCISNIKINSSDTNSFFSIINYNNEYEIDISCSYTNLDQLKKMEFPRSCSITSNLICLNSDTCSIIECLYNNNINNSDEISNLDKDTNIENSIESNYSKESNNNIIIKKKLNKSKEDLVNNLDDLMQDIEIGKVYEIKANDYEVKISPINFKDYEDSSTYINFLNCEKSLREQNDLPPDSILTVIQIEIYKYDDKSLTNQVEYAVFNDKKTKLNLSACEKDKIEINCAITNTSVIDLEKFSYFSDLDIDVLNIKDNFFNDICSNNNSDIILKDRRNGIYENYSLCDNNCEYSKMNLSLMQISCNCEIKSNIETKKPPLKFDKIYIDLFSETSFSVIKCFKLVFNFENKSENIGYIIFPIIIYYIIIGISPINKFIVKEMEKYKYLPNLKSPLKKDKNSITKIKKTKLISKTRNRDLNLNEKRAKISKYSILDNVSSSNKSFIPSFRKLKNENEKKYIKNHRIQTSKGDKLIQPIVIFNYPKNNKNIFKIEKKSKNKSKINSKNKNNILNKLNKINEKMKKENSHHYYLIKIDATNTINYISYESKYYLDNFDYEDAIIYDKRSFWRLYLICLFAKENILSTFFLNCPLELKSMRLILFIFSYSCDFALNTIFYFSEKISDKYNYNGKNIFWFNLLNNLTISFMSFIISFIIVVIIQMFTSSKDNFEDIFREEEKKLKKNKAYKVSNEIKLKMAEKILKIKRNLKCKIIIFICIEIFLMLFFYYFVTAFCEVYKKTQISWLIDCFISFLISFPVEFVLALVICFIYVIAIKYKIKCLYKIAMIFYNLG